MVKRNYHRLNYDPWAWKPIAPETAEEKADRKRREAIAAEKRANKKAEKLIKTVIAILLNFILINRFNW